MNRLKAPSGMTGNPVLVLANHIHKVVTECTHQPFGSAWTHLIISNGSDEDVAALKAKGYPIEVIN
ncbi:MAG: hypothetical protein WC544_01160 [Patescibacteria group bacterium]